MSKIELKEFNVAEVELSGSNLIEASAGTGKTFSIAILVLRLIIEKNIDIREILMLTFTKSAVAEIEGRIRKFIRVADRYISKTEVCDKQIMNILDKEIDRSNREQVLSRLSRASLFLDETSIFTIHSFCQKTLTEFAFETDQLFGCEIVANNTDLIEKAVNKYWREHITTLEKERLSLILKSNISKDKLSKVISKSLDDKKFINNNIGVDIEEIINKDSYIEKEIDDLHESFYTLFNNSNEATLDNISSNKYAIKAFTHCINNSKVFYDVLYSKATTAYAKKLFPELMEIINSIIAKELEREQHTSYIANFYYEQAIEYIIEDINLNKQKDAIFTYNDLIDNLYNSTQGEKLNELSRAIQKKYKAGFIDEFQDTDKKQYEIFHSLFNTDSIIFYIGDPKQSIYSFRGADIDTYKQASNKVDKAFTMRTNFRSNEDLINGLNELFSSNNNPFLDENIAYEIVKPGLNLPLLCFNNKAVNALSIIDSNKGDIIQDVANRILSLLTNKYSINDKAIHPSDIAIIVKTKREGLDVKRALAKLNIPAVTIDETKVLQSEEAKVIFYILLAIIDVNKSNIYRALLNKLTGYTKEKLLCIDDEKELILFKKLQETWNKKGVYACLSLFLKHYKIRTNILESEIDNAERRLSNLIQIIELLHKAEVDKAYSADELLSYLRRILEGAVQDGDEYIQRIESDEDAVKIVTIHKSKGLSYNIVFAPFLNLKSDFDTKWDLIEFKDKDNNYCFSIQKTEEQKKLYKSQTEKENRRLIYVALTRAVYKCYIYKKDINGISSLLNNCKDFKHVEFAEIEEHIIDKYKKLDGSKKHNTKTFKGRINTDWSVSSFSTLCNKHISFITDKSIVNKDYNDFVFNILPKGNIAGLFLHELFENADFSAHNFHNLIKDIGGKYPTIYKEDHIENYNTLMICTLKALCKADDIFQLKDISNDKKITELEFFFDLKTASTKKIKDICEFFNLEDSQILEGAMTGFIDLFFEHNDKYYILDWKSNFLGNTIEDYSQAKMEEAMSGNMYNLQYTIYSLAIKRFLETRIDKFNYQRDFGGILYIFLRACSDNGETGVYYKKPTLSTIEALDAIL